MAITDATAVLLASVIPTEDVNTPPVGGSIVNGTGSFLVFGGASGGSGVFTSGFPTNGDPAGLREVRPGASGLFGKCVQCTGKGPAFRGAVIAAIQVELGTTGGTGPLTECVLVQADAEFRFLAQVTDVEEVPC